jgi:hypothetical protein
MGFEMQRSMLAGLMLLALAGCGKGEANISEAELADAPQIASLEDYNLPVDKSDQITAIDAATGDASGMPRDGGAVIAVKEQEERPSDQPAQAASAIPASNATMAIPEVAAPPPPPPPPPPAAPALTVPLGN